MDQSSARIREFCARHPSSILFDEPNGTLFDVYAGKTLPLHLNLLQRVEEKTNRETGQPYLLLVYDDGRQLVLADVGIAFPPGARHIGPIPELPDAVCFRDLNTLLERFKHQAYGHPHQEPDRETVRLLMLCIAIVDGARAGGFEVSREERELEGHLQNLEKGVPGAPVGR